MSIPPNKAKSSTSVWYASLIFLFKAIDLSILLVGLFGSLGNIFITRPSSPLINVGPSLPGASVIAPAALSLSCKNSLLASDLFIATYLLLNFCNAFLKIAGFLSACPEIKAASIASNCLRRSKVCIAFFLTSGFNILFTLEPSAGLIISLRFLLRASLPEVSLISLKEPPLTFCNSGSIKSS